jgi:hypothetical protein
MMRTHFVKSRRPRFRFSLRLLMALPVLCALGCWFLIGQDPVRQSYWVGERDVPLDILVKDSDSGLSIPKAIVRVTEPYFGFGIPVNSKYDKVSVTDLDGHARLTQKVPAQSETEWSTYRATYRMKGRVIFNHWVEIAHKGYETRLVLLSDFVGRIRSFDQLPPPSFAIELRKGPARDPRLAELAGRYGPKRKIESNDACLEIFRDGSFRSSERIRDFVFVAHWSHYPPAGLIRCEERELLFRTPRGVFAPFDQPRRYIAVGTNEGIYIVPKKDVEKFRAQIVNGRLPDTSEFNVNRAFKPHTSNSPSSVTPSHGF